MNTDNVNAVLADAQNLEQELRDAQTLVDAITNSDVTEFETVAKVPKGALYGRVGHIEAPPVPREFALTAAKARLDSVKAKLNALKFEVA